MSDKLRQGISVLTSFTAGEQPTAEKLSSITAQLRAAASALEEAVGDIHSQSWPYTVASTTTLSPAWGRVRASGLPVTGASERMLDIANIARLIGPASNLNPRMQGSNTVTEEIPAGVHQFSLKYPVDGVLSLANPDFSAASGTAFTTYVVTPSSLTAAGQYSVTSAGKVYCVTATDSPSAGDVSYVTNPLTYGGGLNYPYARFNVIPDPNQIDAGGTGLAFGALDGQGRRTATLPAATHQQSDIDGSTSVLSAQDVNYSLSLLVPKVLVDNLTAGDEIPAGYLFIRNHTTGEVYEDAEYFYVSSTAVKIGNVDLTAEITAGHKFVLLTVGTDITTSIDDLRTKLFHSHDRTFGEPFIPVSSLTDMTAVAGNSGAWVPSEIPGNFVPQYLHRDGFWDVDVPTYYDAVNLNDANVMRGHFVLGYYGQSAGDVLDTSVPHNTNKVIFGDPRVPAERGYIYKTSSEDMEYACPSSGEHSFLQDVHSAAVIRADDGFRGNETVTAVAGIASEAQRTIAPYSFTGTIVVDRGSTTNVTLSDLATANRGIAHLEVLVATTSFADAWWPPNQIAGSTFGYRFSIDTSGVSPVITFYWDGGSWPTAPAENRIIKITAWYYTY